MPPQDSQSSNQSSKTVPPPPAGYVSAPPQGYAMDPAPPPPGYAMDDPKGNYDLGDLGKVTGLRVNGKPATRQDALHFLAGQHVMAEAVASKAQQTRQGAADLRTALSDEQVLKDFMGDLATIGVLGGASKLASLGRAAAPAAASDAELFGNFARQAAEKPQPNLGPGAANVTDPAFLEGKALGGHANYLNELPPVYNRNTGRADAITGADVADYHSAANTPDPLKKVVFNARGATKPVEQMLDRYKTDPDFKNLADAARMYVHNYHAIGDIDKISLGMEPAHTAWRDLSLEEREEGKYSWDVDPGTTMFDGKSFGRDQISTHEGAQMVETLYGAIREANERDVPLYRGITPYRGVDNLKRGNIIELPLSSFSDNVNTANSFGNNFMFELEGPSKHLNVKPFNSMTEGEHLTNGRFEVTGVGTKQIEKPAFYPGGQSVSDTVRYVRIRQLGAF